MHILMIEDTEAVCEMMEMFFENEGWKASFYHDGKEGLDAFLENQNKWGVRHLRCELTKYGRNANLPSNPPSEPKCSNRNAYSTRFRK